MRTIKFRARDTYDDDMVSDICNAREDTWYETLNEFFRDDRWVFMQFTGKHDTNGKEVYEWDVIRSQWDIREVRYNSDMASFIAVRSKEIQSVDNWVSLEFKSEVIGNIYENSDLIKR